MKFATKHIRQYPPHLRYVTTLPREIKKSFFADIQQIWKKMQTNCDIFGVKNMESFSIPTANISVKLRIASHGLSVSVCLFLVIESY